MNFLESIGALVIMFSIIYAYKKYLEYRELSKPYKPPEQPFSDEEEQLDENY